MTPPERILMTTDAVGGVWTFATGLADRLARAGTDVTLVTLGPAPKERRHADIRALPENVHVMVTDLALEWQDPEGRDVGRTMDALGRVAEVVRPDLVHVNGFREGLVPWPCPHVVVAHSCVLTWWQAVHGGRPAETRWSIYAEAVARALESADAWVAPTRAFRDSIESIYRPSASGHVVANGIDIGHRTPRPKQALVLGSGRVWDQAKNLETLARVASHLPWPVEIAGDQGGGPVPDSPNIRWLGELGRAELADRMRKASIYASPARYEPFGLGVLEAAAAGCALVLSDLPTFREIWDGAACFLPADEPKRWRQELRRLCLNDIARHRLQRAAAERAREFTLDRSCAGYVDLYGRLTGRRAGAPASVTEARA